MVALTKPNNDIVNKKLSSISLKRNNIIETSTNGIYVNGGVYFFKNKFLKLIPLKKISLENDIIPILIKKKKFFGKYYPNFFIDIGSHKYFNLAKKKLFKFFFRPALFLDRDGTINQDKKGYTYKLNELKFMPKIIKKLKNFSRNSYYFFIITNQSGIAKKKFSQKNFLNFQRELYKKLNSKSLYINDTEYCPHHPEAKLLSLKKKCQCRKPNNLMIRRIINKWPINIKKSLFVGDQITDYKVSKKSKIKFQYYKDFIKF